MFPPSPSFEDLLQSEQEISEATTPEHVTRTGLQFPSCVQSCSFSYATHTHQGSSLSQSEVQDPLIDRCPHPTASSYENDDRIVVGTSRKRVPVGPNFQAKLPPWIFENRRRSINALKFDKHEPDSYRWLGTCVWPHRLMEHESHVGKGRASTCSCAFPNSVECIRSHIQEKRETLRNELGKAFSAWNFDEMGDCVSELWTWEEQLTFQELVRMNPVSCKKNFWDQLVVAFPSRSMKELVSYYFNVFVLRRRAIQNRTSPEDIDSDDDEMELLDSEGDDSTSVFDETEDEADDSKVEYASGVEESEAFSHASEDMGNEKFTQSLDSTGLCSNNLDDSSLMVGSVRSSEECVAVKATSMLLMALDHEKNQGLKLSREDHLQDSSDSTSTGAHDVSSQEDGIQRGQMWEILHWDSTDHCPPSKEERQPEPPYVSFSSYDARQAAEESSSCREGFFIDLQYSMLDNCESKVWNGPMENFSQKDVDRLVSTNGMIKEFFGEDVWEGRD